MAKTKNKQVEVQEQGILAFSETAKNPKKRGKARKSEKTEKLVQVPSKLEVVNFYSPVVSYSESYTFTHNFQSVKISVGLSLPAENGDIETAYQKVVSFVREKLNEKSQEIAKILSMNDDNIEL